MRYGLVIDLHRCIGCFGCVAACRAEKGTAPGIMFSWVHKVEVGKYPDVKRFSLPVLCNHCKEPACLDVCPTGATSKRPDGIVVVDNDKCIGCRYCMQACPYASRYYNEEGQFYFGSEPTPYELLLKEEHPDGVVEKCDLCVGRQERGLEPACVANCITKARTIGDLDDPESEVSRLARRRDGFQLNPEYNTDPSVFYLPAQPGETPRETAPALSSAVRPHHSVTTTAPRQTGKGR